MALNWRNFVRVAWAAPLLLAAAAPEAEKIAPAAGGAKAIETAKKAPPPPPPQNYDPRPALWLLEDADTKIYLFGTNHMLPAGFKWRSPALERALSASDELVVETYTSPAEEEAEMAKAMPLMFLDKPRPFLQRFPEKHRAAIEEGLEGSSFPVEGLDMMRTWAAAMMLGLSGILDDYGADDPDDIPGVEDILEVEFQAAGKPITSIEDPIAVLQSLNALPEEVQIAMLLDGAEEKAEAEAAKPKAEAAADAEAEAKTFEDVHHWAQGRPEELTDELEDDMPPELYEVLLTRRNRAWTGWLAERLEKPGTVFMAVGAGHLTGKDSVQTMLVERGLEAKRID